MPGDLNLIAVDLGASSGRVILARLAEDILTLEEVHRFDNHAVHVPDESDDGRWCWDILRLWDNIKCGIRLASKCVSRIDGIGIDSWGVDYALLDKAGRLVRPPVTYRDPRTSEVYESVIETIGRSEIYNRTGIQFMPLNTLYQLAVDVNDPQRPLERTATMLMMPQLLSYWLTGRRVAEHTLASTTQLYDSQKREWIWEFADAINVPRHILPEVIDPGTVIGRIRPAVAEELSLPPNTPVIAVGSHDTASAVAATPLQSDRSAFLSSGTWSLLGRELPEPCRSSEALAWGFTNEAGVTGTTRFLKNIAGLWLLQECRRVWAEAGREHSFGELVDLAAACEPFAALIDPDDPRYANPGDMPARILAACMETHQRTPEGPGVIVRCILDSLALRYAQTLDRLIEITGQPIDSLHIVGGGSRNTLLNQITADTTGLRVIAGPEEATAIGNALIQSISLGRIKDIAGARRIVSDSFQKNTFNPDPSITPRVQWARHSFASFFNLGLEDKAK